MATVEQSYHRWCKIYGGISLKGFPSVKINQARKYKDLDLQNILIKKLVADLSPREVMLKEITKGTF